MTDSVVMGIVLILTEICEPWSNFGNCLSRKGNFSWQCLSDLILLFGMRTAFMVPSDWRCCFPGGGKWLRTDYANQPVFVLEPDEPVFAEKNHPTTISKPSAHLRMS
jgi:hypothetical protein